MAPPLPLLLPFIIASLSFSHTQLKGYYWQKQHAQTQSRSTASKLSVFSQLSKKEKKNILFSSSSYLLVAFELLPVLLSWQRSKNAFTRLSHGLPSSKTPDAAATKSWLPSNHLSRKERGRKKRKKKKELELQSKWIHIFSGRYLSSWWQTCLVITGVYRFNLFSLYYTSLGEVLYWTQSFYFLEKKNKYLHRNLLLF